MYSVYSNNTKLLWIVDNLLVSCKYKCTSLTLLLLDATKSINLQTEAIFLLLCIGSLE